MKLSLSKSALVLIGFSTTIGIAANYQWNGSTDSIWATGANWNANGVPTGITAGPGFSGGSAAHRLNVNNAANNPCIYDASLGNTTYANTATGARGLVIGSGTSGPGRFIITGGSFSTLGSTAGEVVGNVVGATLPSGLTIDGGAYVASTFGFVVNFGGSNNVADVTVNQGSATFSTLTLGGNTTGSATLNLNGGVTSVNNINRTNTAPGTVVFGGGTLKARIATSAFMQGLTAATINAGGGTIDTNSVNVTMTQPLVDDTVTMGGAFTKTGAGTLTASGAHTYTGPTVVTEGTLSVTAPLSSLEVTVAAAGTLRVKTGSAPWATLTTELTGNLMIDLGVYSAANPVPFAPQDLTLTGPVTLSVAGSNLQVGVITLLSYGTKTGPGAFTLGTLPSGAVGTLVDTGSAIELHVTSPSVQDLVWSTAGGTWQVGGTAVWNSNSGTYQEYGAFGDLVTFSDVAAGTVEIPSIVRPTLVTINNTAPYTFQGGGQIEGPTGLVKSGTGIATFLNADSYTGVATVNAGGVVIAAANTTTGAVNVATNATYGLSNVTDGAGQTLTFTGPGITTANAFFTGSTVQRGALQGVTGNNTWEGNVSFSGGNARVGVQDGATLTITGNIVEAAQNSLFIIRAGSAGSDVTISGAANVWSGGTEVYATGGAAKIGRTDAIPTSGPLRVGTSGLTGASVFDLNGFNQTVAGLGSLNGSTAGRITNNGATPSTLTLSPVFASANFPGVIVDGISTVTVVKQGSNTQTFSGLNTYTGNTTVSEGTLALNNPVLADAADLIIADAGTLALNFTGSDTVDELTIAGVAKFPGIWGSTASGAPNTDTHLTGTGTLTVINGPAGDAFTAWAAAAGLSGNDALPGADLDADGVPNLLEFALGLSPTNGSLVGLPTAQISPTALKFSFERTDASEGVIALAVQVSDDLQSWPTAVDIFIPATSDLTGNLPGGATVTITENAGAPDTVEVSLPQGSATRKFMRLLGVKL